MSDLDLEAIRARCEAATPGPWEQPSYPAGTMVYRLVDHSPAGLIAQCERVTDTDFIAHTREWVPALLDRIAELERQNATLQAVLDNGGDEWRRIVWTSEKRQLREQNAAARQALESIVIEAEAGHTHNRELAGETREEAGE